MFVNAGRERDSRNRGFVIEVEVQSKEAIEKPILIWEMEEQEGGREVCAPVPASHQEKSK